MGLEPQESIEINGRLFTVRRLPFSRASAVYERLKRVLQMVFADEELSADGGSPLMVAGVAGGVSDEDLKFYVKEFGAVTTVDLGDGRAPLLSDPATQERVFGINGSFEDVFTWLDFAVRLNFQGAIEKMRGALRKAEERAKAKAAKEEASPKE
jgi:hypothetical protein